MNPPNEVLLPLHCAMFEELHDDLERLRSDHDYLEQRSTDACMSNKPHWVTDYYHPALSARIRQWKAEEEYELELQRLT